MLVIPGVDPTYFDRQSRRITAKIDFYFDGPDEAPVSITPFNYLVDFEVYEEAGAESQNPLGAISANTVDITLTNFDNIFSPLNTTGPYYGKISVGIQMKVWIQPFLNDTVDPTTWIPLGIYYVNAWNCNMNSQMAFISGADIIQDILLAPVPDMNIILGTTFPAYFTYVLTSYGYTPSVDSTINYALSYGFANSSSSAAFLQDLTQAAVSYLISSRYGIVTVKRIRAQDPAVYTFTDADQIFSADIEQTIIKTYNGVDLVYALPQVSDWKEILVVENLTVPTGTTYHNTIRFTNTVYQVSAVSLYNAGTIFLDGYSATNFGVDIITTLNNTNSETIRLSVSGKNLDLVEQEITDNTTNMLVINNAYIQSAQHAIDYKALLNNYISSDIPVLELEIRGNPLLEIGDTILVTSERYELTFTGIIKRQIFKYNGGLSCTVTLFNLEVIQ